MSDKSKLGFNINPKNYDELNSTDNLITSGSDSGWLGKKLQGDDSNDLDLSKINPLFDKELYEKYRPGVNTNDGSANQDIWGYKCFNSPVSFRNGIYGDTYSITENKSSGDTINLIPETYATIKSDTTVKNKIYNRTDNDTNNYSEYTYKKYHGSVDYDNSQFTYMDTVIPDSDEHTISDIIIKSHSESHCDNNAFAINDEYERTLCSVRPNYYTASAPDASDAQYVYSVNYANTQYERKLQAYTPAVSTDNYFLTDEKNVTATFSMHANSPYILSYGDEPETGGNILLETNLARTVDGVVSNRYASCNIASPDYIDSFVKLLAKEDSNACNIEVTTNYIQIGATDGVDHTNDNTSSIIITPDYISISTKNNANQSTDNPYIEIEGTDNSITLHAGKLNLPSTIVAQANALSKEINSANYIYATDNSILPSNDSVISLGSESYKYSNIYANKLIGIASAAEKLVYVNPTNNAETELLTVSNENLILPRGNKEISIGNNDHRLKSVYSENFYGTATKAERDRNNNIITDTYFKLDSNNSITGLNYIIGAGEHIRFTDAYSGSARTFTSIATSYADNYHEYCTNLRWSNNDETAFIVCGLKLQISYDPNSDSGEFQILPHVYTDSTSSDITMSMVLGSKDEPLSSIYCNEFPTLYKTIACNQFNTINTPYYGTSIGNIRLLCIVLPPGGPNNGTIIYPGYKFTGMFIFGKNTYHVRLARFNANSPNNLNNSLNNLVAVLPVNENDVDGTWVALSGADVNPSIRDDEMYLPILAMRVE